MLYVRRGNEENMQKITVIFTCFNRIEKTRCCMESLSKQNPGLDFEYIVLDDNSSDGTPEMLEEWKAAGWRIVVLHGDGNSYWAGGMRKAIAYAKEHTDTPYYLLVNDDVEFYPGVIEKMTADAEKKLSADAEKKLAAEEMASSSEKPMAEQKGSAGGRIALVGPMCDEKGGFSYGGIRYQKGIHYIEVKPEDKDRSCDSFNMNCLLLSKRTFMDVPNFDEHYIHSLADFDYGLTMRRMNIPMWVTDYYVGVCPDNDPKGGWSDRSLSRMERLKKKESVKGAPFKPWFYFLKKNFGLGQALLHGFTPYVRILLGK